MEKYTGRMVRPTCRQNKGAKLPGCISVLIVVTDEDEVFIKKEVHEIGIDNPVTSGGVWERFEIEKRWGATTQSWLVGMGARQADFKDQPTDKQFREL